ncbi:MAG: PDZ domain-containing protein [Planctomycetes bacterium]|nr:PDZ domain-containing protein [Planctomycetota bacterium]
MSNGWKELAGWGGVVLVGVVAFWATRPAPRPAPDPAVPKGVEVKTGAGTAKGSFGAMLRPGEGGLLLVEVYPDGSAVGAGLVAGDVVLAVDDRPAKESRVLLDRLGALRPGEALVLRVRRADGREEAVRVELAEGHGFELGLARRLVAQGVAQLVGLEREGGLWPHYRDPERPSVAVTALVAHALVRAGDLDEAAAAALGRARGALLAAQAEDGGLDDPPEHPPHRTYATALALMALDDPAARARLSAWLQAAQVQEAHGFDPVDTRYGGWSYHDRPDRALLRTDVSTGRYALEALAGAGLPDDAAVWDRARLWLDLTQNHALVSRPDDPAHDRERALRDGGFAFQPRMSKAGSDAVGTTMAVWRSYGSATADGVLARLALEGVDHRAAAPERLTAGPEALAGLRWLARRWDLGQNPGFEQDALGWARGVYLYYLAGLADALHRAGVWRVGARVWAAELTRQLGTLHARAGDRFRGESALMHEDSPTLAAAFGVIALAAARDRLALGGGAALEPGAAPPPPPLEPEALAPPADAVARGLAVFRRAGCIGCHVDHGGDNGPALTGVAERALLRWRTAEGAGAGLTGFIRAPDPAQALTRGEWPSSMPPVTPEQVSETDLADLVQFLLSRRAGLPVSEAR